MTRRAQWWGWSQADAVPTATGVGSLAAMAVVALGMFRGSSLADAAQIGGALGFAVGLGLWAMSSRARRTGVAVDPHDGESTRLLGEYRQVVNSDLDDRRQALLENGKRIATRFEIEEHLVAQPRSWAGRLTHSRDLEAAFRSATEPARDVPRLLVVGPAGYGKTVALLELATVWRDEHPCGPVPVIVELGGWGRSDTDFREWLIEGLTSATGPLPGRGSIVSGWLETGQLAIFADGLDEISLDEARAGAVGAINVFCSETTTPLVVTSRPAEYATVVGQPRAALLRANAALVLAAMRPQDVEEYLDEIVGREQAVGQLRPGAVDGRDRFDWIRTITSAEPEHPLATVLRTPLWLWLATKAEAVSPTIDDPAQLRVTLANEYIDNATAAIADGSPTLWTATGCRRWLAAIAGFLSDTSSTNRTVFYLEDLTPPHPPRRWTRLAGLGFGVAIALISGLSAGLAYGLTVGPFYGLAAGLTAGLVVGLSRGDSQASRTTVRRPERTKLAPRLTDGLTSGLAAGLAGGLLSGLTVGAEVGLIFALTLGPPVGLAVSMMATSVVAASELDEGRRRSRQSTRTLVATFGLTSGLGLGLAGGLTAGPTTGLTFGLIGGLAGGLTTGLLFASDGGGWFLVSQWVVRRRAVGLGLLDEHPVPFLVDACRVGVLRRSGGGVQFRHREVAELLAGEAPSPGLADLRAMLIDDPDTAPRDTEPRSSRSAVDVPSTDEQ